MLDYNEHQEGENFIDDKKPAVDIPKQRDYRLHYADSQEVVQLVAAYRISACQLTQDPPVQSDHAKWRRLPETLIAP